MGPYFEFAISSRRVVVLGNADETPHYLVMGWLNLMITWVLWLSYLMLAC